MSMSSLELLAAAAAGAHQPGALEAVVTSPIPMIVGMVVIFWFLILRPQMRQAKEQKAKIASIKKGDQVLTAGGLLGKVIKVDEHYAELELGTNVKVKALKSTISDVIPPTGSAPAND